MSYNKNKNKKKKKSTSLSRSPQLFLGDASETIEKHLLATAQVQHTGLSTADLLNLKNDGTYLNAIRLAVTTGDPAGVGPELMYYLTYQDPRDVPLQAHTDNHQSRGYLPVELVLIGDKALLQERMELTRQALKAKGLPCRNFTLHDFDPDKIQATSQGHISVLDVPLNVPAKAGVLDSANAPYVLKTLDKAIELCQQNICYGIVTAPISKSAICDSGLHFTGHTEYLQEKTNTKEVVMMLGCPELNVALVTTHLPLKDISAAITEEKLTDIITVLHKDLKERMGFAQPAIYVCGLNPHAGENGTLGTEEKDVIIPVLKKLRQQGMDLRGPLPADTIFQQKYLDNAAAILAMYHDQGLPVLKYIGFKNGYNTTLGLPFIRTSVDHGTALDLAGKGVVNFGSLLSAVSLAVFMAKQAIDNGTIKLKDARSGFNGPTLDDIM